MQAKQCSRNLYCQTQYLTEIYEDKSNREISSEQFSALSSSYTKEKAEKVKAVEDAEAKITDLKSITVNVKKFIEIAEKYSEIRVKRVD